jgi:OOP family OmpA-OmpF porin
MDTLRETGDAVERAERELDRALPGAVARSARESHRLAEALGEPVEQALKLSARRNPNALVDALSGVVGRALLRSLSGWIRGLTLALNRALLVSVSAQAWRWRAEAWRTGRRYADVIREHTLACRIRQVFLIHRRSGLLLQSAWRDRNTAADGDMVSAMLTAIQDFVHDSFSSAREERLHSIRVGSMAVWIEQGRHAILAGVIEGEPTEEMKPVFREALDRIHRDFSGQLSSFEGDTAAFGPARLYLESCINTRFRTSGDRLLPLTWLVLCAIPAALGLWGVFHLRAAIAWRAYVGEISVQPGIVVIESGRRDGKFYIRGLNDPLALDPVSMLHAMGIERRDVQADWQPFQALLPELALLRARQLLNPPETVALEVSGSQLKAKGTAPPEWIEEAGRLAHMVPGITSLEMAGLNPAEVRAKRLWAQFVESLVDEPGVIVLSAVYRDGHPTIRGLRDPGALDPARRMTAMGIETSGVDAVWEPYDASAAPFVLARARRILAPPQGVELTLEGSTLVAGGEAPHRWVREATVLTRTIRGVTAFRSRELKDTELAAIGAATDEVAGMVFVFFDQGTDLEPGQARKIERLVERLRQIDDMLSAIREIYTVEVRGHAIDGRDEDGNVEISGVLARRFMELLDRQNLGLHRCKPRAMGSAEPVEVSGPAPGSGPVPKRAVTVRVVLPPPA